jgi:hypothetical protein
MESGTLRNLQPAIFLDVSLRTKYSAFSDSFKMLDSFEILTTSGIVLWSKSYTTISPSIVNGLITNVFIEERTLPGARIADDISAANNPPYKHDQHTLKWTTVKELGLIFVVRAPDLQHKKNLVHICANLRNGRRLSIDHSYTYPGSTSWLTI